MTPGAISASCTVLVIDDDPDIREMLCEIAEAESGCTARAAEDGRKALELLVTLPSPPCLILLDLMMPVMNGREFVGALARLDGFDEVPVTLITAGTEALLVTSGGVLRKPFKADDVRKLIRQHCHTVVPTKAPTLISSIATTLCEEKEALIHEWIARVRRDPAIPQAHDLDEVRLRNNIPKIVDTLIASLRQTALGTSLKGANAREIGGEEAAREHARQRLKDSYTLAEELRELGHLRSSLVDLCTRAGLILKGDEAKLVHGVLDELMTTAAVEIEKTTSAEFRRDIELRELFVAILGHDLRTPLTGIMLASSKLLGRTDFPDAVTKDVKRIAANAARMHSLIEDLLDMARIRHGGLPIARKPTDLQPLCAEVIDLVQLAYPDCTIHFDSPQSVRGEWDAEWLLQLLQNLLRNAIEHGQRGAPIGIEVREQECSVEIEVHNHGLPIPPDVLPTIFDPFVQGEPASRRLKGLGLGLFIAMSIAEGHGGSIRVTSVPHLGTSFITTLPRA